MNEKKLKVIHTPVRFYPKMGGIEHSTYHLCKALAKLNMEVEVICADDTPVVLNSINGIKIKRLRYIGKISNTNITLSLPYHLLREKYDIIHTYMPTPWSADWSTFIAKIKGKKSVISIKNDIDFRGRMARIISNFYLYTLFRITLSLAGKILMVNPDWEKSFINTSKIFKKYKNKIEIVTNGIDFDMFRPSEKKDQQIILFISLLSKFHRYKGLDYLIESMNIVLKECPEASLWIIGEGELKSFYEEKVRTLGMDKYIKFLGEVPQVKLEDYYNQAPLLVLPSTDTEGFGNVLIESLSCKTPVVATDIVGMAQDIIDYDAGLIIKTKDSTELAKAMIKLLGDPILRKTMGENGRKLVEDKYDWMKIAQKVKDIYSSLVNKSKS